MRATVTAMWDSPIAHARQCLDDHLNLLQMADTRDRLQRTVVGFVLACQRNPYLRTILDAYEADNERLDRSQDEQRAGLWSRLSDVAALANEQDDAFCTEETGGWTAQRLRSMLTTRIPDSPPKPFQPHGESNLHIASHGLELLVHALLEASPARKGNASALSQLNILAPKIEWLDRQRESAHHLVASRIWAELLQVVNLVNTPPGDDTLRHWLDQYTSGLFETNVAADRRPKFEDLRRVVLDRVQTLVAELRMRLGVRATHDAAVRRYAWGAVTFRREELIAIAEANSRTAERHLTADAARFLFAEGFDVLTEVSLGAVRLDLVSFGDAILIEAKRYGPTENATERAARKVVYDGAKQLHDYAGRCRGRDLETDNFLLIFRLGGVRLDLPRELAVGNTRLHFQLVDLAPAAESGSKSPAVVVVTAEDIATALR